MFSVLCINQVACRRKKFAVEAILSPVRAAAPYLLINVTPGKKGIDWRMVAEAAGGSRRCMLIPEAVTLPLNAGIETFEPKVMPLLTALNSAANFCKSTVKHNVLVVDRKAVLAEYIDRIVPHVRAITVVTDLPESYYESAVRIMESFGASIKICSDVKDGNKFDIAVASEEVSGAEVVFTAESFLRGDCRADISADCIKLCPDGIDPFLFACALFECCGLKSLSELTLINR